MKKLLFRDHGRSSLERRLARSGILFTVPLMIGLILFFIIPIFTSFIYSISNMQMTSSGIAGKLSGISTYIDLFSTHPSYRQTVFNAMRNMLLTAPLTIIFSFFIASTLNQNFFGRTFFRVVLFLPVIVNSIALSRAESGDTLMGAMNVFGNYKATFTGSTISFTDQITQFLANGGFSDQVTTTITDMISMIYSVIDISGIQILILLTGMQSISPSLYEAAKVEGGSSWENFWKITFPMVSPLILTTIIYTVVDSFTSTGNTVMSLITDTGIRQQNISLASAMGWVYFFLIIVILGLTSWLVSRKVFYYDE